MIRPRDIFLHILVAELQEARHLVKTDQAYPIGTPGKKWGEPEKKLWLAEQTIKRSYAKEVLAKVDALADRFDVHDYGSLSHSPGRYPLYIVRTRQPEAGRGNVLITGGVHGYETSGVQGALRFLETEAAGYVDRFNLMVAPCVSPWAYETINRWNPLAVDPNRSFYADSPSQEAAELMRYLQSLELDFLAHFDLHETTDTDNTEFRPALSARDAVAHDNWHIPDGFYLVGDTEKPVPDFQAAIIRSVEQVTHIAPPDPDGKIIGEKLEQPGVINYAARQLGLCMGLSGAPYVTTTEMYPDSPKSDDENCIQAQVAAITGGLDFLSTMDPGGGRE
jgi:hypothetical protein